MTIDPYVVRIPQVVLNSKDQEWIAWYIYDNRWKHDVWRSLGGGSSTIDSAIFEASGNSDQIGFLTASLGAAFQKISDLEAQISDPIPVVSEWLTVDVSADYTADDGEEINATLSPTITMPTSGRVKVNNQDGSDVVVNFTGQTIFGDTQVIIQNYGSVVFKYQPDSDTWGFE